MFRWRSSAPRGAASAAPAPAPDRFGALRFRDPEDQRRFERDGFLTVPFLDGPDLAVLLALWDEIGPDDLRGIYSNVHDQDLATNRRIDHTITSLFRPASDRVFDGAHLGGASFLVKGVGPDSASTLHQDWNNVEEDRAISLSIWCPLVDVGPDNGQLVVIPGSHRLRHSIRSLDTPSIYLDFDEDVDRLAVDVPVRAGEAVLYAHSLFHGSRPNRTGSIRVAAVSGVLPPGARNVHYRRAPGADPDAFEVLEIERDFYFGGIATMKEGVLPSSARPSATVTVPDHELRLEEVVGGPTTAAGDSGHLGWSRRGRDGRRRSSVGRRSR